MSIRASSSRQIDTLISDLAGDDAVRRDAAVARLTVIGARAMERLLDLAATSAKPAAATAALRALEGIGDDRAVPVALRRAADDDAATAAAAIAVARPFLRGKDGAAIVDRLTALALDLQRPDPVRAAAVQALRDLEARTVAPLLASLAADPSASVRAAAQPGRTRQRTTEHAAADGSEPVRQWLAREGPGAPLTSLLGVIERARERAASESATPRAPWATTRAAAHLVLARRASRIALYDLKEWLEKDRSPLPMDALAALALIGDQSCLESIAAAHQRSKEKWWRDHLLEAFHGIVKREHLTPRHAVMKKIAKRWPRISRP